MKTRPIETAVIDFDGPDGVPHAPAFGDRYHARAGAREQADHVFLGGNGLPHRWQGRSRFVILETGFGLGHNFLAAWAAWRADPQRCARLDYVSVEAHPPTREQLVRAHAGTPEPEHAAALVRAWPPATHNLHRLDLAEGRLRLHLALGDVRTWLPELVLQADAIFLDGFAPALNPAMWSADVMKAIGRLAAPHATAATWSAAAAVREGLRRAGFDVERAPGFAGKREMTVARFAPRVHPAAPPGRPTAGRDAAASALVIGAGLAGASVARELAEAGVVCTVLDAQPGPAGGASGNPGGLVHGTLHADDGPHARWHRAAALHLARRLRPALDAHALAGRLGGLLRLETRLDLAAMRDRLARLGLPDGYVMALDRDEASRRAGLGLAHPAWFYPDGGWVDPGAWVRHQLAHPDIRAQYGAAVARLERHAQAWHALDAEGRTLATAPQVVVAAGTGAAGLAAIEPRTGIVLETDRGQITRLPAAAARAAPRCPVSGDGYVLTLDDGDVLCGATRSPGDTAAALRDEDTRANLERYARLAGVATSTWDVAALAGRVGQRVHAADRLPLAGPMPPDDEVPGAHATRGRRDQPRFIARECGLYVIAALGSRGIASSALAGALVAAWMSGAPMPVEASLLDAVDPARERARRARVQGR